MSLEMYGAEYAALEAWVLKHLRRIDHEWRVTRIALALFDLLRRRHKLNQRARGLLALAAMAHDVGRSVDTRTHPRQGAKMILRNKDLPLGQTARRRLAYLTLYHRGPVPKAGQDGVLGPREDFASMRLVLALLRVADALDSRRAEPPSLRFTHRGRRLRVHCHFRDSAPRARKIYRRKKFRLLERLLSCKVELRIRCGQELTRIG
jgi:exopolyphosphatase/pppGpp-phosphohydrolase